MAGKALVICSAINPSMFFFLDSFLFSMVAIYYINKIAASVHAPTTNPTPQVSVKTKKNR